MRRWSAIHSRKWVEEYIRNGTLCSTKQTMYGWHSSHRPRHWGRFALICIQQYRFCNRRRLISLRIATDLVLMQVFRKYLLIDRSASMKNDSVIFVTLHCSCARILSGTVEMDWGPSTYNRQCWWIIKATHILETVRFDLVNHMHMQCKYYTYMAIWHINIYILSILRRTNCMTYNVYVPREYPWSNIDLFYNSFCSPWLIGWVNDARGTFIVGSNGRHASLFRIAHSGIAYTIHVQWHT